MPDHLVEERGPEFGSWQLLSAQTCMTCRRPNSSKWLIRKVLTSTIADPADETASSVAAAQGASTDQTGVGIGRHCQNSRARAKLANST